MFDFLKTLLRVMSVNSYMYVSVLVSCNFHGGQKKVSYYQLL